MKKRRPAPSAAITLREVAAKAGVSLNTASRALTGKPDVNRQTKARVLALAQKLGYSPNHLARSLVRGRTQTVGLVVTDCTDPFYASLIRAVEGVLSRNGFSLLLATSNEDTQKENGALSMLRERRVDGLLLTPVDVEAGHLDGFLGGALPIVLVGRRPAGYKGPFVGVDNVTGGALMTRHLIGLGHRDIAHFTRRDKASSARERLLGYRTALKEAGIPFRPNLVHSLPPSTAGGRTGASAIFDSVPRPSAVFTYNDSQAVGLLLQLLEAGIRVPDDLSIGGFDDIELGTLVRPLLTTIAQPIREIGEQSAQILIDMVQEKSEGASILLPPILVARDSAALRSQADALSRRRVKPGTGAR